MREINLLQVENAFLLAMAADYAATEEPAKGTILEMAGSKTIEWKGGGFKVRDTYVVTPRSNKSAGVTMVWYQENPVWFMSYGGEYPKEVIPFLRSCLRSAYVEEQHFYGGRGPRFVRDKHFTYANEICCPRFELFSGTEYIHTLDRRYMGYHWYRGMSLL